MTDHTYAAAYADWQAELREAARRPACAEPDPATLRGWFRRVVRARG